MNIAALKKVYCVGLGGVGVSAVAKYFLAHGVPVSGSDPVRSPLVDDVIHGGGQWFDRPDPSRISKDIDLLVYTDDARPDHPERQAAQQLKVPTQNFSMTLGEIMSTYRQRICLAGTNGKSTTTALTGLLLEAARLHPTVFVGSRVSQFNGNLRLGAGQTFVAEADEYRDHFLNLHPTIATITNIELDHLDYFYTLDRVKQSFERFADLVPSDGQLVVNADDANIAATLGSRSALRFGLGERADLRAIDLRPSAGQQTFRLYFHGQFLGHYTLHLPGIFNIMNALAAIASALAAGVDPSTFVATIAAFRGVWRRFEIINPHSPVTIINDYAHHPTAVRGTLEGAKAFYPGRRIVAVFQPHHHNRLTRLFKDFTECFAAADESIIVDTYSVPGREPQSQDTKTGQDLAAALKTKGKSAAFAATPSATEEQLEIRLKAGDVCIIMGAGDIWRIAEPLAKKYA